jgi:hypothetical protein
MHHADVTDEMKLKNILMGLTTQIFVKIVLLNLMIRSTRFGHNDARNVLSDS